MPLAEFQKVFDAASEPKPAWVVKASDHVFSQSLLEFDRRLLEAVRCIAQNAAR